MDDPKQRSTDYSLLERYTINNRTRLNFSKSDISVWRGTDAVLIKSKLK